ncbi:MAG TPA: hypothetical protein VGJ55_09420 [Pyrinomonadaceae bacterium]|jgi:hypothetical protein
MIYGKDQFAENFWEYFGVRRQSEAATALWMQYCVIGRDPGESFE